MDKLTAVNRLLGIIRERHISTLEGVLKEDARTALQILDNASHDIQSKGWSFNTDRDFDLPLNASNEVDLPETTLVVTVSERHAYQGKLPMQRGSRLYNPTSRDYKFDAPVHIDRLVTKLEWEDLPPVAQSYIVAVAKSEMLFQGHGDQAGMLMAQRDLNLAEREMKRLYANDTNVNLLDGPSTQRIRRRPRWA